MSNDTKVTVTVLAGALATIAVWIATALGLDVPAPIGAAVTTVIAAVLGLVVKTTPSS